MPQPSPRQDGAAPGKPVDSFAGMVRALTGLESQQEKLKYSRAAQLTALSTLLVSRMAAHRELFEALVPDYSKDFPTVDPRRDVITSWSVLDLNLVVRFGFTFRGEYDDFGLTMPVRYLEDDGEKAMALDAAALRLEQEASARLQEDAVSRREREMLTELLGKHPDMARPATPGEQE